jgi:DNA polymerase III epsilon subunit-like protein
MTDIIISPIDFLKNKKVIIFDTETTGLPQRRPNAKYGSSDEYYDYYFNDAYESARIVSIAWYYTNNFTKTELDKSQIHHYIRKPDTFTVIPTTHIHGISFSHALQNGIPISDILNITEPSLHDAILQCDYIIAHNVMFDIHILMNELHRLNLPLLITKLKTMLHESRCICTGQIGKPICKLQFKSKYPSKKYKSTSEITESNVTQSIISSKTNTNYKMPKLSEFYNHLFNRDFENAHSASGDVTALLEILSVI